MRFKCPQHNYYTIHASLAALLWRFPMLIQARETNTEFATRLMSQRFIQLDYLLNKFTIIDLALSVSRNLQRQTFLWVIFPSNLIFSHFTVISSIAVDTKKF